VRVDDRIARPLSLCIGRRSGEVVSEKVCIQYELGQNGWSNFRLNVGTASVVVGPFGYCTDALMALHSDFDGLQSD
jgi:hypothetical protein